VRHVKTQIDVDPAIGHTAVVQALQIGRAVDHEAGLPEGMRNPGTVQLVQVHPQAELADGDLLQHGRGTAATLAK
jgi:hypothetical protein